MSAWDRIRWNNVARAAAAVVAVAVVIAWPRLASPAPDVPDGAAIPAVAPVAATAGVDVPDPEEAAATDLSGDSPPPEQVPGDRPRAQPGNGRARAARRRPIHPRTPGRPARIPKPRRPAASGSPRAVAAPATRPPTTPPQPAVRTPKPTQAPVSPQAPAASPPEFGFER